MIDPKRLMRRDLITARNNIPDFARKTKNERIAASLSRSVPWKIFSSVHIYESINSLNEVDTKAFISYLTKTYPLLAIFTSRKMEGSWKHVSLDGEEAIGIKFDIVVVPTLGFDNNLNRLGYGGGYYDKFLSSQNKAIKVGLCFEVGHVSKVPKESYDVALNYVITEKQVYTRV